MEENHERLDSSLKLLVKSSVIVFIGIFLSKVFSYIYRIIIARQFGPEVYGLFSLATMVFGIFVLFSTLGIEEGLTRYIPLYRGKGQKEKIKALFKKSAKIMFITSIIAAILLFLFSGFISNQIFAEPKLYDFLIIIAILIPINIFLSILLSALKGYEKIGLYSFLSNILLTFIHVILILLLIYLGLGASSVILSYVLGAFIVLILSFLITKKQIPELFQKSEKTKEKGILKEVIAYSFPLFLASISWKLFRWGDSFIIGIFGSASDVGIYNAAVPIGMLLAISSQLFMQLFFPLITRFYSQGDKKTIKELSHQVSKWIFMINLPFLVLFILFPTELINLFFGQEYLSAANALRFFSIGIFFLSFFEISYRLIAMKGLSKILFADILIISIINIILNIILVPILGITGAAIATMISYILLAITSSIQAKNNLSIIPINRKMLNITIAALISSLFLIIIKLSMQISLPSLLIFSIFYISIYFLFVFLFRGFDKNDLMVIKASLKKLEFKKGK